MGVPNEDARIEIMKQMTKGMKLESDFSYKDIARLTPGYVGADLSTLCKEASIIAVERIISKCEKQITQDIKNSEEEIQKEKEICIELTDFKLAVKKV
jgi:SpoVK/Ycf46/Vps4 family AAA+-type ATPase